MSLLAKAAQDEIRQAVLDAAGRAVAAGTLSAEPLSGFNIEVPAMRLNGDFSANVAMAWAKDLKLPPRKIAELILENLDLSSTFFERCEVAGPGFMNFYLNGSYYAAVLKDIMAKGEHYGRSDFGQGKKINVEFVSANPTGPMHMGNARGGALGDCLAAVLDYAGYAVSREFYVNDAGNQIDKFALSLDIRDQQIFKGEGTVELPEDSYHGEDILQRAREFAEIHGDRFLNADEAERRKALVAYALPKNLEAMRTNLEKYRIEYDTWFHESTLYNNGELDETLNIMKDLNLTYEKDGALWYKNIEVMTADFQHAGKSATEIEKLELKDEVLIRANGNPTYFAADIAYHRNKLSVRGFDRAINIWGADHHGHVARMKGALDAIGVDGSKLDIILMQLVRLTRDGEVVKMSKRTGKAITLVDLLEEIPIDAVRFWFNLREPSSQMEFDLDLAVEQSAKNPVYYCQYAHARICSILTKLTEQNTAPRECASTELERLDTPEERELISHLAALTDEIIAAAGNYDPARITRYTIDLATLFHKFYNVCRVNCGEESLMQSRITLCRCVQTVLFNVLTMLKITVPDTM
ncbi:MAG: arginine--tRNA ligase [Clostridiales bacterium]|nr:arginine--tRNA ligase [Clostridiales bacterium]